MLQNVLNMIIDLQGVNVTIKSLSESNDYLVKAAISNYFRSPVIEEDIESIGRQYVISTKNFNYIPKRGDTFVINDLQYFSIANVHEMTAFSKIIGYRLILK